MLVSYHWLYTASNNIAKRIFNDNTFFFNDSNLTRYKKKRDNKLLWANAEKEVKTLKNAEISMAYFSKRI